VSIPTAIPGWSHFYSGKVRDLYEPADGSADKLLVVASDRISAFDFVLEPAITGKGTLLTQLSNWWFSQLDVPNHLLGDPASFGVPAEMAGKSMVTKRLNMYPVECVVRGYLTGSGWVEYQASGTVCGIALPVGLTDGDRLPEPIYTPAYKAPLGEHDENITFEQTIELVGADVATALRDTSLAIYSEAASIAESRGVILADTKFEFGADAQTGLLTLADEVLTSDSSRYWDAAAYAAGGDLTERLASFDKQIVRNWLSANWDKQGIPPVLPAQIVERTLDRYRELYTRLTGESAPA
jgi:phosphoribosylaminoimidazole-succinocarboxamide synthase